MEEKDKKEKKEKTMWNEDLIRKVIAEEGITNSNELRKAHGGAYNYIHKNGLRIEDFGLEWYRDTKRYTVEEVNELIRENRLTSIRDIRRLSHGMYNFVYNNKLQDKLEWPYGRENPQRRFGVGIKPREKRYDIWKVMHLLKRYAREEGISLRDSAVKYGYFYEWYDLVRAGKAPEE